MQLQGYNDIKSQVESWFLTYMIFNIVFCRNCFVTIIIYVLHFTYNDNILYNKNINTLEL